MALHQMLLLTASWFLLADKPKTNAVREEMKKLHGTWVVVTEELRGKKDGRPFKKVKVRFVDGKMVTEWAPVREGDKPPDFRDEHVFTLFPARNPKAIDISWQFGTLSGVQRGIYRLESDTLTFCLGLIGPSSVPPKKDSKDKTVKYTIREGKRPSQFNVKFGYIMTLKREKK